MQSQLLEGSTHMLEVLIHLKLGGCCATKIVYVVEDVQPIFDKMFDNQKCHILTAHCRPPQAK